MFTKSVSVLLLASAVTLLSGCGNPEEKEARYLRQGNDLFNTGQYDKARIAYKNAAKLKPADPEVSYRMGLVDEAVGNLKDAFNNFTHATQQDAHFNLAQLKLAEYYLLAEMFDETQKRVDGVLQDDHDNAEAHAVHGALLSRQKDNAGAEAEGLFALKRDPDNVIAISLLSSLYSSQNDEAKALALVEDALKRNPKNLSLLLIEANLYEHKGNLTQADGTYQKIFAEAPTDSKYHVKLAMLYANAKQFDKAEKTLRDAIAALPDNWELRHQLVQFLSSQRGMEESEKEIRNMMSAFPDRTEPYVWLVSLYESHGAIDRAEAALKEALTHNHSDKQDLALKSALAHISFRKGNIAEAKQFTAETLAKDPNNLDALFIRANIRAGEGDYQNAIADLRAILRDRPNSPQAMYALAEILLRERHLDLATETLNQLVALDPLNNTARVRLAQLYSINNNNQHAMDLLFAATKLEPKLPSAWETTARVAIAMHDKDTAEMAIGKLEALDNHNPGITWLHGQLLESTGKQDEAIKAYQSVITSDPTTPAAEQSLIALYELSKRDNHIPDLIAYLTSLKSNNPTVQTLLGDCYLLSNQQDNAATAYDTAITNHPQQQSPYLARAKIFYATNNIDQAHATLEKAVTEIPADPRAMLMQAELASKTNHPKDAIKLYTKILDHNPDLDAVANNLAELIADYDYENTDALQTAKQVAERFAVSPNPLLLDTLAWVYHRQGQTAQALALMDRAAGMKTDLPPQFHYHYGVIQMASGNTQAAIGELKLATTNASDYPGLEEAKAILSKQQ
jgi:tetratricopeptide (TPR) repeat protein